ncbi:PQQ-binding-like beta-propeller repeat protein [Actinomadura sp. SCN-SB]|uniref:outer membrane protein assembly factor BamB family protein n=1 Tax=Actinomadura sp. SCN-SB TaxID=3373092 RepID=UPI0037516D1D
MRAIAGGVMTGATVAATLTACLAAPADCDDAARLFARHRDGGGLGSGVAASASQQPRDPDDRHDARFRDAPGLVREALRFRGDAWLGRLRWFASHRTVAPGVLSPVTEGVVTIGAPTRLVEQGQGAPAVPADHRVGALRARDGRLLWSRSGESRGTGPGIQFAGVKELAAGFDLRTGGLRWCAEGGTRVDPGSVVAAGDGTVVTADLGGDTVTRIRLADGERLWSARPQYERREMSTPDHFTRLALGEGVVAAGTVETLAGNPGGELGVYRLADGRRLWRLYDPHPDDVDDHARGSAYTRQLLGIAGGGLVAVERHSGTPDAVQLTVYEAATGRVRWTREVPFDDSEEQQFTIAGSLVLAEMDVPAPDEDGTITGWRIADGGKAWTLSYGYADGPDLTTAVVTGRHLYTKGSGGLIAIDLKRGAMSTTRAFRSAPISAMAAGDGVLVVQIANLLLAFDLPRIG